MKKNNISPKVVSINWGQVKTETDTYKDVKLFPGGARVWDWNETGTRHKPGIQAADVQELIEQGAEIIILSKGIQKRLLTCEETTSLLQQKGIEYYILQSEQAVEKYNELREDHPVGALIHSTC